MKKLAATLGVLIVAARLLAQTNAPVRLALIAETGEVSVAADVLTAQLSGNPQIQLLERNEIEKVYREQGLSAANRDYIKLGQILGADGVILFQTSGKDTKPVPRTRPAREDWLMMSNRWSAAPLAEIRQAAERGDATAQYYLGRTCFDGSRGMKDEGEGLKWIQRAADGGLANAQGRLGWMYDKGVGFRQDYGMAAKFYRQAAEQGHAMAQNNLGRLYQQGLGVPQDMAEAVRWYRKSAEQGEALGQANLEWMYEHGYQTQSGNELSEPARSQANGSQTYLALRLVAVKPGVILVGEEFSWPITNLTEWAGSMAIRVESNLPKLTVLEKDAIPISVVNLRSAVQSTEAKETERQLKLLTIQRLSQERQFFVLERQRMQILSEEKERKADESAFWNGCYLLEGVLDPNGYSKDTITIAVQLTPPRGQTPLKFTSGGSRTNLAEVVNRLARQVAELLKVDAAIKDWKPAEEAQQYFAEAQWALKWQVYSEAQAAAESAWALGKQDQDCAMVRVKAYLAAADRIRIEKVSIGRSAIEGNQPADRDWVIRQIRAIAAAHPGAVFALRPNGIESVVIENSPDPQSLDAVIRALGLYREFSQTLPPGQSGAESSWFQLGTDVLTVAGQTLQHFYLVPRSQKSAGDKLAQLRESARAIAEWMATSLPGRDRNFNRCLAAWGCFWQENPEECAAVYQKLKMTFAFDDLEEAFCSRGLEQPRLTAWAAQDRKRIPRVWKDFVRQYGRGFNFAREVPYDFGRLEAAGLNEEEIIAQYSEYWTALKLGQREPMVMENQKRYLREKQPWDMQDFDQTFRFRQYSQAQALAIKPLLDAYRADLIAQMRGKSHFENSIRLEPALRDVDRLEASVNRILGSPNKAAKKSTSGGTAAAAPIRGTSTGKGQAAPEASPETLTNCLLVKEYFRLPEEQIPREEQLHEEMRGGLRVVGCRWGEGNLVLDMRYDCALHFNGGGSSRTKALAAIFSPEKQSWRIIIYPSAGNDRGYPVWPGGPVSVALFHGSLYLVQPEEFKMKGNQIGFQGRLQKYDFQTRRWQVLPIPDLESPFQLSVVNDRLYAANAEGIFEVIHDGESTRVLASTRRRPATTALDLLDSLGAPVLYGDSKESLRAVIGSDIYAWDGSDWKKKVQLGFGAGGKREAGGDAIIFHTSLRLPPRWTERVWILPKSQERPELALCERTTRLRNNGTSAQNGKPEPADDSARPRWILPEKDFQLDTTMTFFKSNLYCLAGVVVNNAVDGKRTTETRDEYRVRLICFNWDSPEAIVVSLRFEQQRGSAPVEGLDKNGLSRAFVDSNLPGSPDPSASWMVFAGDSLLLGDKRTRGLWSIPIVEIEAAVAAQKALLFKKEPPPTEPL